MEPYRIKQTPLYHVTAPANRERIRNYGLLPSRPVEGVGNYNFEFQPEGIYTNEDPDEALWWERQEQSHWKPSGHGDIWEIDPNYVEEAVNDKILDTPVITHPIPPEALTLRNDLGRYWEDVDRQNKEPLPEAEQLYPPDYSQMNPLVTSAWHEVIPWSLSR